MQVKTQIDITSCNTFNCIRENGPPMICEPIRLAGIMKKYSNKAMPQLKRMIRISGQSVEIFISCNFRLPYHAKVIKTFDTTSKRMVNKPLVPISLYSKSTTNVHKNYR